MAQCQQCGAEWKEGLKYCTACGAYIADTSTVRNDHKATGDGQKRWIIRGSILLILLIVIWVFLDMLLRTYHPIIEKQPYVAMTSIYGDEKIASTIVEAKMIDGFITIPLKFIREHKLVSFVDPEQMQMWPLLAYVTPQGKLVTAIGRSEQCGSTDFFLQGNNIHCASCPSYWNMSSLEAYACCPKYYPDPFPSSVVGDDVRIDPAYIRNWKSRL